MTRTKKTVFLVLLLILFVGVTLGSMFYYHHSEKYTDHFLPGTQINSVDVGDMTVEEAVHFFENVPSIRRKIQTLYDVGLGYVKLGQPSTELSGGEAQRIKLASELSRKSTGRTIYILDEPTTGLHFDDVAKLSAILHQLAEGGNTVVVIEHNLDIIKTADYIIDMGPEGGDGGGTVIAQGTPEEIAREHASYTGYYIDKMLRRQRERSGEERQQD